VRKMLVQEVKLKNSWIVFPQPASTTLLLNCPNQSTEGINM
jgi:hypothetical protein